MSTLDRCCFANLFALYWSPKNTWPIGTESLETAAIRDHSTFHLGCWNIYQLSKKHLSKGSFEGSFDIRLINWQAREEGIDGCVSWVRVLDARGSRAQEVRAGGGPPRVHGLLGHLLQTRELSLHRQRHLHKRPQVQSQEDSRQLRAHHRALQLTQRQNDVRKSGLATNSIFFCFLFVKTHWFAWRANQWPLFGKTLFSSVPPCNSLVSVLCIASRTTEKQGHRKVCCATLIVKSQKNRIDLVTRPDWV